MSRFSWKRLLGGRIYCAHFSILEGKRREHSARCVITSKTRKKHATAVVDDECGHEEEEQYENRPQKPSLPIHVENQKIFQKSLADAECVSTVEQSMRDQGPATAEPPQFSATVTVA